MTSRYKMLQFVLLSAGPQIHQKRVARLRSVMLIRLLQSWRSHLEGIYTDIGDFGFYFYTVGFQRGGYYLNK
jgi:hypothetical protein